MELEINYIKVEIENIKNMIDIINYENKLSHRSGGKNE